MKKTYNVDAAYNNMRIDRWVRNNVGNIPQGFIEKSLRNGKIKINRKKIKGAERNVILLLLKSYSPLPEQSLS